MEKNNFFNQITQVAIPTLTIGAQVVLAMKVPQWALILMLAAQPFWIYSTWKSYKQAGQIGIFINTVIFTFITAVGVINYWIL